MEKAEQLLNKEYMIKLLREKVLPLYPDFIEIESLKIQIHKKLAWDNFYHMVLSYDTIFTKKDGSEEELPIFCSAHSEEPRENVFKVLNFLWESGFGKGHLSIPHPLFYSEHLNGTFYRGAEGKNLYRYIRVADLAEVENIVPKAAEWFAKLHKLSTDASLNFNEMNSRIRTVIPGSPHILERIRKDFPQHLEFFSKIYEKFINDEEQFLALTDKRWLVHGDAHPENIIHISETKIAVIDFTDLCLTDFARDLGAFSQQLEYMCNRKIEDKDFAIKMKKLFLDTYFKNSEVKLTPDLQARIDTYYYWTASRTAIHFLMKHDAEPARAEALIEKIKKELKY